MAKKKIRGEGQDYSEVKVNINIALTPTAKKLLQERAKVYGCRSVSDLIEKWARQEIT
jgi:hypothetical protein